VENPKRRPSFAEETGLFRVRLAAGKQRTPALDINRSCAKCHTVLFSRYPFTWEGGARHDNPGGSHINSGEARDFLLGGCSARMACTACHDPHAEDSRARLAELEGARGNALCVSCHRQFGEPGPLRAHTHHLPGSTGSACLSCHMPKKNMGLSYELTRYHRIGSPTDRERVEGDRPLECALCHADKSVEQMTRTMERLWGKRYERSALRSLYGNLDQNIVLATLRHGKPHEQAVASAIAGQARMQQALPLVVDQLGNEYPLVRFFAKKALEELTRKKLELDMNAPGPELLAEARQKLDLP
jgi:predicted CXXCH cytochrome family protein